MIMILEGSPQRNKLIYSQVMPNQFQSFSVLKSRITLKDITAEQAYRKINPNLNTIWEIVNHLIQWRKNILRRVQGETIITPDHNYFVPVIDPSEVAWAQSLQTLAKSHPNNNHTYYEHIHGIIQHDVYHLGQIVILKKLL